MSSIFRHASSERSRVTVQCVWIPLPLISSSIRFSLSVFIFSISPAPAFAMPALLTRMSSLPNAFFTSANILFTPPESVTSAATASDFTPFSFFVVFLGGLEHEIVDDDVRALGSEAERDRAADAATCAGDERDLVLESHAGTRRPGARRGQGLFGFRSTGERENRPHAADSRGCRSRAEESRAKTARERILPLSERAHAARADHDRVRAVDAVALVVR